MVISDDICLEKKRKPEKGDQVNNVGGLLKEKAKKENQQKKS